eukprot:8893693-Pyramimonas_sp.AAC.1
MLNDGTPSHQDETPEAFTNPFYACGNIVTDAWAGRGAAKKWTAACEPVPFTDQWDATAALVRTRARAIIKNIGPEK